MSTALFKFCTAPGAIAVLEGNAMFITSPLDLNDPFEMRPAWTDAHQARHRENEQRRNELMAGVPLFVALEGGKLAQAGKMPPMPLPLVPTVDVENQRGIADMHNETVYLCSEARLERLRFQGQALIESTTDDEQLWVLREIEYPVQAVLRRM